MQWYLVTLSHRIDGATKTVIVGVTDISRVPETVFTRYNEDTFTIESIGRSYANIICEQNTGHLVSVYTTDMEREKHGNYS